MNLTTLRTQSVLTPALFFILISATTAVSYAQAEVVFATVQNSHGQQLLRFDSGNLTYATSVSRDFGYQYGVTTVGRDVLVGDLYFSQIQKVSSNGVHLGSFAPSMAYWLESDSSQNVYSSAGACCIGAPNFVTRYDSAGNVTGTFSHPDMPYPGAADADAFGNVYVNNSGNSILKFASDGTYLETVLGGATFIEDLAIDERNEMMYVKMDAYLILVADISNDDFNVVNVFVLPNNLSTPGGIHYSDSSETLLVADNSGFTVWPAILEYSPAGDLLDTIPVVNGYYIWDIATYSSVPEPGSISILLALIAAASLRSRRRNCAAN